MRRGAAGFLLLPLLLAVSAFAPAPLQLAPRHSAHCSPRGALRGAREPRRAASWRMAGGGDAGGGGGDATMQELLGAAAAARAQLQTAGPGDAGALALSRRVVGDRAGAADGAAREALLAALADHAASVVEDVYAAPEPPFKMMPKGDDRTAKRVAAFGTAAVPAAAVRAAAASGAGLADFTHRLCRRCARARTRRAREEGWDREETRGAAAGGRQAGRERARIPRAPTRARTHAAASLP